MDTENSIEIISNQRLNEIYTILATFSNKKVTPDSVNIPISDEEFMMIATGQVNQAELKFDQSVVLSFIALRQTDEGKKLLYDLAGQEDPDAIFALRYVNENEAAEILLDIDRSINNRNANKDLGLQLLVLRGLMGKDGGNIGAQIINDTYSEHPAVRQIAFYALRGKAGNDVTKRLIQGADSNYADEYCNISSVLALKDREGENVTSALLKAAKSHNKDLRICALWALQGREGEDVKKNLDKANPEEILEMDSLVDKKIFSRELQ